MNTNSNVYTIGYASIVVIIVAFLLAFVSTSLKSRSDANERIDKKKQILAALNFRNVDNDEVEAQYEKYIVADEIIDIDANVVSEGKDKDKAGFLILTKDFSEKQLPLYICKVKSETKYVFPLVGKGLWGEISGYVALNSDKNTVFGAYFTHKAETAGLGARITELKFQNQFIGKKVFSEGTDSKIALNVTKYGQAKDDTYDCDGISGATLTSNGVSNMIHDCFSNYKMYLLAK